MFSPKIELESSLRKSNYSDAQPWCNFALLEPTWLPGNVVVSNQQLRPESIKGRSSYRCEYSDQSRKLSVKQFLYDWAPPAYDHPSLWRNNKISPVHQTPIPRFFYVNNDVAWIGLNFRRQPALSLNIKRTMVEMTVIEGTFADEELIEICKGLQPASPQIMDQILATPFSDLCYFRRHSKTASEVPLSYWKYNRQKNWMTHHLPISNVLEPFKIPSSYGYHLNSVFTFGDPVQETEYYYEHQSLPGSYIRILISPDKEKNGIPYPPKLGDQVCTKRIFKKGDHDIHHAYLYEEVGPHEAIWHDHGFVVLLLVKPAKWTSLTWFEQLIKDISGFHE